MKLVFLVWIVSNMASNIQNFIYFLTGYKKKLRNKNELLHRIGLRLTNRMKMEITRLQAVDTGRLRNSVQYRVRGNSVTVSVFNARYAKFVEYGTRPSARMARFLGARMGEMKRSGGVIKPNKGVVEFRGRGLARTARIRPRPFFWNSIEQEKDNVNKMIVEYLSQ